MGDGYVIEYITRTFGEPNASFETDPRYLAERRAHADVAGRFVAVHRLRPSARLLLEILGEEEFNRLQDMWATGSRRYRWSVAFPIIQSFGIADPPLASDVVQPEAMRRLFAHPSATLRPLNDDDRRQVADLVIFPRHTQNAWLGIADEIAMAERSEIDARFRRLIDHDLARSAMEGLTEEQRVKVRVRAAWLAYRFIRKREQGKTLFCDECGFDPTVKVNGSAIRPRSLLDVHHKRPLDEGVRYTSIDDFSLLCPNCHRFTHELARLRK